MTDISKGKKGKDLLGSLQKLLAISREGAIKFVKASSWTTVNDMAMALPYVFVYFFINQIFKSGVASEEAVTSSLLWTMCGMVLLFIAIMLMTALKQSDANYYAVYAESSKMRIALAERLRKLPLSFFDRHNASDLTARVMGDVTQLESSYSHFLPQGVASMAMALLMGIGLFTLNWSLALALLWPIPIVFLLFWLSKNLQRREFVSEYGLKMAVSEKMEEGFLQVATIKSYRAENRYLGEFNETLQSFEKRQMRIELIVGLIINGIQALLRLGFPSLLIVGASLYISDAVTLEVLLFFFLISAAVYEPIVSVLMNGALLLYTFVHIDRMNELYNLPSQEGSTVFTPSTFDISFDKVSFAYVEGEQVIDKVSFVAKQGEITALCGSSGGGKSTCARLAARFADCQEGRVTLGGTDLKNIDPETLLSHYSIVFQDVVLFNASVLENIRIGRREATDEEVLEAARLAQCNHFVEKLVDGYQTMIGENGSQLSGGERQRISIARAILKNAPVVIMDEATASQDAENESLIQRALSRLIRNKTVIVIAHRMRTIANADKIVVLKEGRVAESGTPAELYQSGGIYASMVDLQRANSL